VTLLPARVFVVDSEGAATETVPDPDTEPLRTWNTFGTSDGHLHRRVGAAGKVFPSETAGTADAWGEVRLHFSPGHRATAARLLARLTLETLLGIRSSPAKARP
jgi:hypothetical protein